MSKENRQKLRAYSKNKYYSMSSVDTQKMKEYMKKILKRIYKKIQKKRKLSCISCRLYLVQSLVFSSRTYSDMES